ncbi:MAG: molybdopterin-guanine dinucleotide biosynthesis protein B [Candidatus Bathyarchaeia archaeon]
MFLSSFKPVIAVVGNKNSGKTMTIEMLTRELSRRGYRVATVKHIPKHNFTIDREGTDTWRHAKAGARVVVSVAPEEMAIIKRVNTENYDLTRILMECGEDIDIIILEGFRRLVARNPQVLKVIAVKDIEEIEEASKRFSPVLAYVGSIPTEEIAPSINYINIAEATKKIVDIVHERVETLTRSLKPSEEVKVLIDGRSLPCARFVREILRKTVLAMISTLKGTNISGDEKVHIIIESTKRPK